MGLEVAVQILVRVRFIGIRREKRLFDAVLLILQPGRHGGRLMNSQVIDDQQDLAGRGFDYCSKRTSATLLQPARSFFSASGTGRVATLLLSEMYIGSIFCFSFRVSFSAT